MKNYEDKAILFLRLGLAFSFLYVVVAAYLNPESWVGFIPAFIKDIFSERIILYWHLAFNSLIGIWLLINRKTFYAAVLACLNLATIIIFNFNAMDIVFRDVGLLGAAVALAFLTWKKR